MFSWNSVLLISTIFCCAIWCTYVPTLFTFSTFSTLPMHVFFSAGVLFLLCAFFEHFRGVCVLCEQTKPSFLFRIRPEEVFVTFCPLNVRSGSLFHLHGANYPLYPLFEILSGSTLLSEAGGRKPHIHNHVTTTGWLDSYALLRRP